MADSNVRVAPDSSGKKIDTSELTVGTDLVERQRVNISSPIDPDAHAAVKAAADASPADKGLVVVSQTLEDIDAVLTAMGFDLASVLVGQATAAKQDTAQDSLTSIDLKLGAQATAANQSTIITKLSLLDSDLTSIDVSTGNIDASLAAQATAAKQDLAKAVLDAISTKLTTIDGHVDGLEGSASSIDTKLTSQATAAKQDLAKSALDLLHTDLGTIDGHVDGLEASAASLDTKTPAIERQASGTINAQGTGAGSLVALACPGANTVLAQLTSAAFVGTLIVETLAADNVTWLAGSFRNTSTGEASASLVNPVTGQWLVGGGANAQFRVRCPTYVSGSIGVALEATAHQLYFTPKENVVRGGAKGATASAVVTSRSLDADHQGLDIYDPATVSFDGKFPATAVPADTDVLAAVTRIAALMRGFDEANIKVLRTDLANIVAGVMATPKGAQQTINLIRYLATNPALLDGNLTHLRSTPNGALVTNDQNLIYGEDGSAGIVHTLLDAVASAVGAWSRTTSLGTYTGTTIPAVIKNASGRVRRISYSSKTGGAGFWGLVKNKGSAMVATDTSDDRVWVPAGQTGVIDYGPSGSFFATGIAIAMSQVADQLTVMAANDALYHIDWI